MKKAMVLAVVFAFVGAVASAAPVEKTTPKAPADFNGLNKGGSEVQHLYLYEKDPVTWEPVVGGAWGKMNFSEEKFLFSGHGLAPYGGYALIYYPDPWPGNGCVVLGAGEANDYGDINLRGDFNFKSIPNNNDQNKAKGGAKIWLVVSDDVTCPGGMTDWNPGEYLFEYDLIHID